MPKPLLEVSCTTSIKYFAIFPRQQKKKLPLHKFKRISYERQYAKTAKPIYQIRSSVIRKKHTTLLAKNARHPYSLSMANSFDNVLQYIRFSNSSVLQYVVKRTWPHRQNTGAMRLSHRMILSKNSKYFIPISHKKSFTKIVTAPHTKFVRDFFRCGHQIFI